MTSVLVLPHPNADDLEVKRLRPNSETEMTAMQVVMDYEKAQVRQVEGVHEHNLGYDVTSLNGVSGKLRLIEVKGLAAENSAILLTPNERRAADPQLQEPIPAPASFPWHEVSKAQHYWLEVDAMTRPMRVREERVEYEVSEW